MGSFPGPASERVPSSLPLPPARIEEDRHVAKYVRTSTLTMRGVGCRAGDDPGDGRRRMQRDGLSTQDPAGLRKPAGSCVLETEEGRNPSSLLLFLPS
jgi:hypothetical protein